MIFNKTPAEYLRKPSATEKPSIMSKRIVRTQSVVNVIADQELQKRMSEIEEERFLNNVDTLHDVINLRTSLERIKSTRTRMMYNPERKLLLRRNGYVVKERDFDINEFVDVMNDVIITSKRFRSKSVPALAQVNKPRRESVLRIADITSRNANGKENEDNDINASRDTTLATDATEKEDSKRPPEDDSHQQCGKFHTKKVPDVEKSITTRRHLPTRNIEPPRQGRRMSSNAETQQKAKLKRVEEIKLKRDRHHTAEVDEWERDDQARAAEAEAYRVKVLSQNGMRPQGAHPRTTARKASGKTTDVNKNVKSLTEETIHNLTASVTPKVVNFARIDAAPSTSSSTDPDDSDVKVFVELAECTTAPTTTTSDETNDDDDDCDLAFEQLMRQHSRKSTPRSEQSDSLGISDSASSSASVADDEATPRGEPSNRVRIHPTRPSLLTAENLVLYEETQTVREKKEGGTRGLWRSAIESVQRNQQRGSTLPPASELSSRRSRGRGGQPQSDDRWLNLVYSLTDELHKQRTQNGRGGRRLSAVNTVPRTSPRIPIT